MGACKCRRGKFCNATIDRSHIGASNVQSHHYDRFGGVRNMSHATIYTCIGSTVGLT
jgi:hypothetical protein